MLPNKTIGFYRLLKSKKIKHLESNFWKVAKSRMLFPLNKKHFVMKRLWIRLLIFIWVTPERERIWRVRTVGVYPKLSSLRISQYSNIFAKGYNPNWSEESKVLWLKKLKILFREYMLFLILTVNKLLECFTKKNCQGQNKFRLENVIKRNLYVKCKRYNNFLNTG